MAIKTLSEQKDAARGRSRQFVCMVYVNEAWEIRAEFDSRRDAERWFDKQAKGTRVYTNTGTLVFAK